MEFFAGAYGALIGAGGGFILVPALLILFPNEAPEIVTGISLMVVFLTRSPEPSLTRVRNASITRSELSSLSRLCLEPY
jgi:ABC-type spermidine/putrescine transport system permease subunit II